METPLRYQVIYHRGGINQEVAEIHSTDNLEHAKRFRNENPHPADWHVSAWTIGSDDHEVQGLYGPDELPA